MYRIARITTPFEELKRMVDSGGNLPVLFRSSLAKEDGLFGFITDCSSLGVQFPITVNFSNGAVSTFTADGYEYAGGEDDNCYIVLREDSEQPMRVDGKFESFMQLAATEGVSVEVAMKLYKNFK